MWRRQRKCGGPLGQSANKFTCFVIRGMSLRRPKLDWIKTVLADAVVLGERAGVGPLEIVGEITEATPSNSLPIKPPEDSAQLDCFSR